MEYRAFGLALILLICAAKIDADGIVLESSVKLGCNGVKPLAFVRTTFLMLEFDAWLMTDNTIQLYLLSEDDKQFLEPIVTWQVPDQFMRMSAYRFQAIDAQTFPYPTCSFVGANSTHVLRFQCGPQTLCYPTTVPTPIPLANSSNTIQVVDELYPNSMVLMLISTDTVVIVQETQTALVVLNSYTWSNFNFMKQYEFTRVTGHERTEDQQNLLVSLAPNDPLGVGAVINMVLYTTGFQMQTVTLLPTAPQNFFAWRDRSHPSLIYYWLMQVPYTDPNTHNAFLHSMGGGPDISAYSGTTFRPGTIWSHDVFVIDPITQTALILSGNDSVAGFDAWAPILALGLPGYPETQLGSPTHFANQFSLPHFGTKLLDRYLGQIACMGARNVQDGCWYALLIDWTGAGGGIIGGRRDAPPRQSTPRQHGPRDTFDTLDNCRPANCNFETAGDCPVEQCWAKGGSDGGFHCCKRAPV